MFNVLCVKRAFVTYLTVCFVALLTLLLCVAQGVLWIVHVQHPLLLHTLSSSSYLKGKYTDVIAGLQ